MSGVSIGWFDPVALYPSPEDLAKAISRLLAPQLKRNQAWPFAVSSIRWERKGVGVAYAALTGSVPVHIDTVGLDDSDGRIFQFVLAVENRPALLIARAEGDIVPKMMGFAPPDKPGTFYMGAFELKAGMAVHFDITEQYHGIVGLPVPIKTITKSLAPRAIIVQVSGYAADQVGEALEHAILWISRDMGASHV